jgi:hypothetical protein
MFVQFGSNCVLYVNRHFQWWNITSQVTDHLLLTLTSKQSCA